MASGSLPLGVPDDFYARIAKIARDRSVPFALDTSGPSLGAALDHGVDLLKPSLSEMRELTGQPLADPTSCVAACKNLVAAGQIQDRGADAGQPGRDSRDAGGRLARVAAADPCGQHRRRRRQLPRCDGLRLASGLPPHEAFRHGVAAGSAALLSPGTQLCRADDVRELLEHVVVDRAAQCLASFV